MGNKKHRLVQSLLLIIFSFLFIITVCYQAITQQIPISPATSECRVVQHRSGKTCIPMNPQRIVALEARFMPDALLSLGIKPVGIMSTNHADRGAMYFGLSTDELSGIEIVGNVGQPSLEKILMLKPDLILSSEDSKPIYKQLSVIAPTVVLEMDEPTFSIKDIFRSIAKVLDQEEKAEEVLAQYQKRVKELQERIDNQLQKREYSFIAYYASHGALFEKPASSAPFFQVLNDIGVKIKPVLLQENQWTRFSIEKIDKFDADVLFILNPDNKPLIHFMQKPLLASLKAVKNHQMHIVDPVIWMPYGPLGMNKLLDELEKYLVNTPVGGGGR
jgi:iron complex transport system substrate-binding protein